MVGAGGHEEFGGHAGADVGGAAVADAAPGTRHQRHPRRAQRQGAADHGEPQPRRGTPAPADPTTTTTTATTTAATTATTTGCVPPTCLPGFLKQVGLLCYFFEPSFTGLYLGPTCITEFDEVFTRLLRN